MDDILSPVLKRLANLRPRNLEEDEMAEDIGSLDLSGLRQPRNDPIPDPMNGGSIPERYDVRANSVMMPVQNMQQPEISSAGVSGEGLFDALSSYFSPEESNKDSLGGTLGRLGRGLSSWLKPGEDIRPLMANTGLYPQSSSESFGISPEVANKYKSQGIDIPQGSIDSSVDSSVISNGELDEQAIRNRAIDEASPAPADIVFGSTDQVANRPDLMMQLEQISGGAVTPEMMEATTRYEKILSDLDQGLTDISKSYDEQMTAAQQRILSNQPNDMDKFYVGMALLMPAILGGVFGKEVGLASLGGGLQGIGRGIEGRQKAISTESDRLANLTSKKAELEANKGKLEIEKLKVPETIRKQFPDEREHLKGMTLVKMTDPETGQEFSGVKLKPDLIAHEEYLSDKESVKSMRKAAEELATMTGETQEFAKNAKETAEIIKEMKKTGSWGDIYEAITLERLPKWAVQSVDKVKYKGKMVNPYVLLHENYKKMADQYRRVNNIRASLTGQEVTKDIMPNIFSMALSAEDGIDAVLNQLSLMEERTLSQVESQGFYRRPVEDKLANIRRDIYKSVNRSFEERESRKGLSERRYQSAK